MHCTPFLCRIPVPVCLPSCPQQCLCRTSDVFVRGDIQAATVNADGTSTVTVSGVTQSLSATLGGISKAYVDAASGGGVDR
jgi:hypothetical protein